LHAVKIRGYSDWRHFRIGLGGLSVGERKLLPFDAATDFLVGLHETDKNGVKIRRLPPGEINYTKLPRTISQLPDIG